MGLRNKNKVGLSKALKQKTLAYFILSIITSGIALVLLVVNIFAPMELLGYISIGLLALALVAVILGVTNYPKYLYNLISNGLVDDFSALLNSFSTGKTTYAFHNTNIEEIDEIKLRASNAISSLKDKVIVDKEINKDFIKLDYVEGYEKLITHDSFLYNLPFMVKLYSYDKSGLVLVKIIGEDGVNKKVIEQLMAAIKRNFSTETKIGLFSNDSLIVYVSEVESVAIFKELCTRLYSDFTSLVINVNKTTIYTCKIGASVYPYSLHESLVTDAQKALLDEGEVDLFIPKDGNAISKYASLEDIRRKDLQSIEFLNGLYNHDPLDTSIPGIFSKNIDGIAKRHHFNLIGSISVSAINVPSKIYNCTQETSFDDTFKIFDSRINVSFDEIEGLYNYRDKANCFYSTRREDLPPSIARFYDTYGIQAFYGLFFFSNSQLIGMIYLASNVKIEPLSSTDSTLICMELQTVSSLIIEMLQARSQENLIGDFNKVLISSGQLRYVINQDDFVINHISKGLLDQLEGKKEADVIGKKCYEVLFKGSEPCKTCPLISLKKSGEAFDFAKTKYNRSRLSEVSKSKLVSILMTPVNSQEGHLTNRRYDLSTSLSSRTAFNEDLDNFVKFKAKGSLLFINLEGVAKIVTDFGEDNLNAILSNINNTIRDLQLDDKIYRYDDGVVALIFNDVARVQMYDVIEKIHQAIYKTYPVENNLLQCNFRYFEINSSGNFANVQEVYTLIRKGFVQIKKIPSNYMCIANEAIVRVASRKEYIIKLMEDNFLNKAVEFRIQPMVSLKDNDEIVNGEILLRLYDVLREEMLNPLEIVQICSEAKKMGKFDSLNYENALGLYNKYSSGVFKIYDYRGFTINLSSDSINSNEWLAKIKHFIEKNKLPDKFLGLEIPEKVIFNDKKRVQVWLNELRGYHLRWLVDNYVDEYLTPTEIAELGFDNIKIQRKLMLDALVDKVSLGLLESIVREAHLNNMKVITMGVEAKENAEVLKNINVDFAQGFLYYPPLKIDEFLEALQEDKKEQLKRQDANEKKEDEVVVETKPLTKKEIKQQKKEAKLQAKKTAKLKKAQKDTKPAETKETL